MWNRGRIESEEEELFNVFFVDHGDFQAVSKSNVIPISSTFLLRLPCQVIECRLVGIQDSEETPTEVLSNIYSFSNNGKDDLYVKIVSKELKPTITNGRKYSLSVYNKKGVSLNKLLVDSGNVPVEESEKKYLEDIAIEDSDDDSEKNEKNTEPIESSLVKYLNGLDNDMLEDEDALEFLKEFASKLFPLSSQNDDTDGSNEVEDDISNQSIIVQEDADALVKDTRHQNEITAKVKVNQFEKRSTLKIRDKVLTPQVLWCQNQLEAQIKVLLSNVCDYNLECTLNNISFRCYVGEKCYAVDLRLYGVINPQMTRVTVKPFHVLIVLTKLASPLWPRLHADEEKHRWINLDVESLTDKENEFREKIRSAKRELEIGMIKEGKRDKDIHPCSDSEYSLDEFDLDMNSEDSHDED